MASKREHTVPVLLTVLLAIQAPAIALASAPGIAIDPWKLERRPDSCVASGTFDGVAITMSAGFDRRFRIGLSSAKWLKRKKPFARIEFYAGGTNFSGWYRNEPVRDQHSGGFIGHVSWGFYERLRGDPRLAVMEVKGNDRRDRKTLFANGIEANRAVAGALLECIAQYDRFDIGSGAPVSVLPTLKNSAIFGSSTYPAAALAAGVQGTVTYRVTITAHGYAGACEVVISSGSAELDRATCQRFLASGRFSPARDKAGNATVSVADGRVSWHIPGD